MREVEGAFVVEDIKEEDNTRVVTLMAVVLVCSSMMYGYRKFWEECRGEY